MSSIGLDWRTKLFCIMLPAAVVVVMCIGMKFPPTERAAAGVTMGEMFKELAQPMFLVLFLSMFLTAASELAPGQWVDLALTRTVHMPGILLLVYVSGIMFVARHFAGPLVHKLSPDRPALDLLPAGVDWSGGPQHRRFPGDRCSGRDSLGLRCLLHVADHAGDSVRTFPERRRAADGTHGHRGYAHRSTSFCRRWVRSSITKQPGWLAASISSRLSPIPARNSTAIKGAAAQLSFKEVAILPAILLIVFGAIWMYDRSKGGFKAKKV